VRDLLVHVDGNLAGRRRVQCALDLAARCGARVTGLHVTPLADAPPLYKPSRLGHVLIDISADLAADAEAAAALFAEEAAQSAVETAWLATAGDVAGGIRLQARCADLVLLGQYEWQAPLESHPSPVAQAVVLHAGRPVLVLPASLARCPLQKVAVAWDGSREAVRALHDALPLLRLARSVHIVTILSANGFPRDDHSLMDHLKRHGVMVDPAVLAVRAEQEHAAMRQQVEHGGFDTLVMGGYAHPSWFEFMFGGATTSALLSSPIPVLLSH
jgi:nucleotide-binding universal stress UspA family protein